MRLLRFLLPLAFIPLAAAGQLGEFLSNRCADCHADGASRGGISLDKMGDRINGDNWKDWVKVLQQIERRSMPPVDEDQPGIEERRAAELELEKRLVHFAGSRPAQEETVLRRLNKTEYRNTIRDLLEMKVDGFDPTREFPEDTLSHGFPTNGEKLVTSGFLLRQYLEAADTIIDRARLFGEKPELHQWELKPPFDRSSMGFPYTEREHYRRKLKVPQPYQTIHTRTHGLPKAGYHPIDELRSGVPESGWYDLRIEVEARFRNADLDPKKFRFPSLWDPTEPIRLAISSATLQGIDPDNKEALNTAARYHQSTQRELAVWDLPDDQRTWLETRVWLEKGEFFRLDFPNGPTNANSRLTSYLKTHKRDSLSPEQLAAFEEQFKSAKDWCVPMYFESPRIHVSNIEITGPHFESWPPASRRILLGDKEYTSDRAAEVLEAFASRAWRRPVEKAEITPFVELVKNIEKQGDTPEAAIQEGFKAILCSPSFLYREERSKDLTDHEIAARLSYFLWSSIPDEPLLQRAAAGELRKPGVLREEALRMLADPKSQAFVEEFTKGWLSLRKLGSMAPDIQRFGTYYNNDLEPAMKRETQLFFRHLLATNGPVDRFLDSDYSFLNKELASLYKIDPAVVAEARGKPVEGLTSVDLIPDEAGRAPSLGFAKVKLGDPMRGGLLGQASILTLTANGVDTSPVIRGIWILDNLLGAHPPAPPPDIPAVEPDIRGARSIRDQLVKHRESSNCRTCHQQIDPPGFALENFDPIGRWRGHYVDGGRSLKIDASGEFGETSFNNVREFKAELFNRKEMFVRNLTDRLFLHALGRELGTADRPALRTIVKTSGETGSGLRDLILLCIESDLFQKK